MKVRWELLPIWNRCATDDVLLPDEYESKHLTIWSFSGPTNPPKRENFDSQVLVEFSKILYIRICRSDKTKSDFRKLTLIFRQFTKKMSHTLSIKSLSGPTSIVVTKAMNSSHVFFNWLSTSFLESINVSVTEGVPCKKSERYMYIVPSGHRATAERVRSVGARWSLGRRLAQPLLAERSWGLVVYQ